MQHKQRLSTVAVWRGAMNTFINFLTDSTKNYGGIKTLGQLV